MGEKDADGFDRGLGFLGGAGISANLTNGLPPSWLTPEEDERIRGHVGPSWDHWLAQFGR